MLAKVDAVPRKPLKGKMLEEKANALSALVRQDKAVLCGYYTIETLEDGQEVKQANLKDFFNALIEVTFTPDELRLLQEDDEAT